MSCGPSQDTGQAFVNEKRRIFELNEANALLPQLESILEALIQQREQHENLHDRLFMEQLLAQAESKPSRSLEEEIQAAQAVVREAVAPLKGDRSPSPDIAALTEVVRSGKLAAVVSG